MKRSKFEKQTGAKKCLNLVFDRFSNFQITFRGKLTNKKDQLCTSESKVNAEHKIKIYTLKTENHSN